MTIAVFGKDGQVGWELLRALAPLGEVRAFGKVEADFTRPDAVARQIRELRPRIIVNAAAYTAVDRAEDEVATAALINCDAVAALACAANEVGAWVIHYSTDYVHDGNKAVAYVESDPPNPLSVYGRTKLAGDEILRQATARHLILRTSWVFGCHGNNFAKTILRLARERADLRVVADQFGAPTSAELIADVTAQIVAQLRASGYRDNSVAGLYHLTARGETSWYEYARWLVTCAHRRGAVLRAEPEAIVPICAKDYAAKARRPMNSRLECSKISRVFDLTMPDWRFHAERLVNQLIGL